MKVLFLAAEVFPFVSVGGLSQVMYFLPRALLKSGHDARIFTPKYGLMDTTASKRKPRKFTMEYEGLRVPINSNGEQDVLICNVKSLRDGETEPYVYFLENQEYYELRANVYEYKDDHIRFALLSKGCLEWLQELKKQNSWWPDIIHCNDWHTGYFVELAKKNERYRELLANTPVVFTIHNLRYQGNYDFHYAPAKERDEIQEDLAGILSPKLQKQNPLLRGIFYANAVSTVSPTYASEILTPEYGEGLENELGKVRGKLVGILNGLDMRKFNPATDRIIKKRFGKRTFPKSKAENKRDLQRHFRLPQESHKFLLGISGRLSQQKGWDVLLEVFPRLLTDRPDIQLIVIGSGSDQYRRGVQDLHKLFPEQLGVYLRSDFKLPRKLFAGADVFLIPSLFEPGGIVALEALRYGAVPLVRRTGGLNDIIQDFDPATASGNGFSFIKNDAWTLYGAIIEALTIYRQPALWKKLVRNCLSSNFSWDTAAEKYVAWYKSLIS